MALPDMDRFYFATKLIEAPGMDTYLNAQIITQTPFAQANRDTFNEFMSRLGKINRILPEIKSATDDAFKSFFGENAGRKDESVAEILESVAKEGDPNKVRRVFAGIELIYLKCSDQFTDSPMSKTEDILAATNHLAINMAAKIYKGTANEETKRISKICLIYFVAIESLILGAKTNSEVFALSPEDVELSMIKDISVAVRFESVEGIKQTITEEVFEGRAATPIKKLGDMGFYSVLSNPPEDPS